MANSKELPMKLYIDTSSNKVLYAEASKEVVDFLFSLLALPLSKIISLVKTEDVAASIGSIHKSVESLDNTHFQFEKAKTLLLNPTVATLFLPQSTVPLVGASPNAPKTYYRCSNPKCETYTVAYGSLCSCGKYTDCFMNYGGPKSLNEGGSGFVKMGTYVVMDDLTVAPTTTNFIVKLLRNSNMNNVCTLEECMVKLGTKEAVQILRASLQSRTVLTDTFIGKKPAKSGWKGKATVMCSFKKWIVLIFVVLCRGVYELSKVNKNF